MFKYIFVYLYVCACVYPFDFKWILTIYIVLFLALFINTRRATSFGWVEFYVEHLIIYSVHYLWTFILFYLLIKINAAVVYDLLSFQQGYLPHSPSKESKGHNDSITMLLGGNNEVASKQSLTFLFLTTLNKECV